jgi:hypothetical protein
MKLRSILTSSLVLFLSARSFSQQTANDSLFYPFQHCVYLEFIGNSETLLSLNYEHILNAKSRGRMHYTVRAGFGFYKRRDEQDGAHVFSFPLEAILIYGKRKHYIEAGFGYTSLFGKRFLDSAYSPPAHFESYNHIYVFRLGYRYMYNGFLLRLTPLYIYNPDFLNKTLFRGSISIGFAL